MTRIAFLGFLAGIVATKAAEPQDVANRFATLYNEWVAIKRVPGTINAREIWLWHEIKAAWKVLDRTIRYE